MPCPGCRAEFCTLPDYASPNIGRFRSRCGGGVRIRGGVWIRQSGSDFNEGMHNLAGVQISAQHRDSRPFYSLWSRPDETKTIKPAINDAFVAFS